MKHLPRARNRFFLLVGALLLIAAGALLIVTATLAPVRDTVQAGAESTKTWYTGLAEQSHVAIGGRQDFSWMTIAWVAILIIVALFALAWIFSQGGGKTKEFDLPGSTGPDGSITPKLSFVNALLADAIGHDRWVASTKTSAWEVKGKTGVAIDVNVYKGTDPTHIKNVVDQAIARLDSVLGVKIPVRVLISTNLRSRIGSAERVK